MLCILDYSLLDLNKCIKKIKDLDDVRHNGYRACVETCSESY